MIFNIPLPGNKADRLKLIHAVKQIQSVNSSANTPNELAFDVDDLKALDVVLHELRNVGFSDIAISNQVSVGQGGSCVRKTKLGLVRLL